MLPVNCDDSPPVKMTAYSESLGIALARYGFVFSHANLVRVQ